jgi:hypothetical protein
MTRPKGEKTEYAPGYPTAEDIKVLHHVRRAVVQSLDKSFFNLGDQGTGVDGTDVAFTLPDGRTMRIQISIEDRPKVKKAA